MRNVIAVLIGIAGVCVAVYLGLVVMFIGGVQALVDAAQESPVSGGSVAWGVARILLATTVAGLTVATSVGLALLIADD